MQGGVDPRNLGLLPWLMEGLEMWNTLWTGDGTLYPPKVDLGGSDQDDIITSCIVFFRSWLSAPLSVDTKSAPLSVDTKRTRNGHGQSPYWPRMPLIMLKYHKKHTRYVSSPVYSRRVLGFIRSKADEWSSESDSRETVAINSSTLL